MALRVFIFPRAERDAQSIFEWLRARSQSGAVSWWEAFEAAATEVADHPQRYGLAAEDGIADCELRQFLFKTPSGRTYRGVFTVAGDEVRILRVRGPGQPPLASDEME